MKVYDLIAKLMECPAGAECVVKVPDSDGKYEYMQIAEMKVDSSLESKGLPAEVYIIAKP